MKDFRNKLFPILILISISCGIYLYILGLKILKYYIGLGIVILGLIFNGIVTYYNDWKMPVPIPKILKEESKGRKSDRHIFYYKRKDKNIKFKSLGDNILILLIFFDKALFVSIGDILIVMGFLIYWL